MAQARINQREETRIRENEVSKMFYIIQIN